MSMNIRISNPTPNSMRLRYYVEFDYNDRPYSCEYYRDGSRQIFFHDRNSNGARKFIGTPKMNETLDQEEV